MRKVLGKTVKAFSRNERGATMIEYGLLVGLIAVVSITLVTTMGTQIADFFQAVVDNTGTAPTPRQ